MEPTARALLGQLVDYAGLFPPAALPLEAALDEYLRHRASVDAWMLGRFIAPASLLSQLDDLHARPSRASFAPLALSVVTSPASPDAGGWQGLVEQMAALLTPRRAQECRLSLEAFESKVDARLLDASLAPLEACLERESCALFLELDFATLPADRVRTFLDRLRGVSRGRRVGCKLRCGGVEPQAVPSIEVVASAIESCVATGTPLKMTAGLHHPVRHHRAEFGGVMHGFLNVMGGAVLAASGVIEGSALRALLAEEDPAAFQFRADQFAWRGASIPGARLAEVREQFVTSFGSCSFDEPTADLRELGLLDRETHRETAARNEA